MCRIVKEDELLEALRESRREDIVLDHDNLDLDNDDWPYEDHPADADDDDDDDDD